MNSQPAKLYHHNNVPSETVSDQEYSSRDAAKYYEQKILFETSGKDARKGYHEISGKNNSKTPKDYPRIHVKSNSVDYGSRNPNSSFQVGQKISQIINKNIHRSGKKGAAKIITNHHYFHHHYHHDKGNPNGASTTELNRSNFIENDTAFQEDTIFNNTKSPIKAPENVSLLKNSKGNFSNILMGNSNNNVQNGSSETKISTTNFKEDGLYIDPRQVGSEPGSSEEDNGPFYSNKKVGGKSNRKKSNKKSPNGMSYGNTTQVPSNNKMSPTSNPQDGQPRPENRNYENSLEKMKAQNGGSTNPFNTTKKSANYPKNSPNYSYENRKTKSVTMKDKDNEDSNPPNEDESGLTHKIIDYCSNKDQRPSLVRPDLTNSFRGPSAFDILKNKNFLKSGATNFSTHNSHQTGTPHGAPDGVGSRNMLRDSRNQSNGHFIENQNQYHSGRQPFNANANSTRDDPDKQGYKGSHFYSIWNKRLTNSGSDRNSTSDYNNANTPHAHENSGPEKLNQRPKREHFYQEEEDRYDQSGEIYISGHKGYSAGGGNNRQAKRRSSNKTFDTSHGEFNEAILETSDTEKEIINYIKQNCPIKQK